MSNKTDLKHYFETGNKPTEQEYADLIDSSVNNSEDKASLGEAQSGTNETKYITPKSAKRSVETFASGSVPVASISTQGKVELATLTEVQNGTDTQRAVTPEGAKRAAEVHSPIQSVNGQTGNIVLDLGGDDSGWQTPTLLNGIINYSTTHQGARYRKKGGVVYIEGLVKGGTATGNVTVFKLPIGFRPNKRLLLNTNRANGIFRTDVASNGDIICHSYSSTWTSISGISFLVD